MAHFHARRWRLDRRRLLRGAGAAIALPLLDCMRFPRGVARGGPERSGRCVFVYFPNGVQTLDWQIRTAGAGYEPTAPLAALEAHRAHVTPLSGLHHPNGIGKAHQVDKIWLTGASLEHRGDAFRNGVSADQVIAEHVGVHTRFPSLELALTGGTLAWSRDGVPLPADRKTRVVFERIFGGDAESVEAARRGLRRRASVLDLVLDDARSLRRALGGEDCRKLEEYLSAVREVERRTERADAWLDAPRPEVDPALEARLTRNIPDADAGDYYRTVYDLIVLALRTDTTRVVTCMLGSESHAFALPEIGIRQTRHELSHHSGDPEQMRRLTRADTFLTEHLAHFLDRLREAEEDGEPLLDHTCVLYGSGMAYGHGHGNANLPLVLAGGSSLGFRHGRHLDWNLPAIGEYDLEDANAHYAICVRPVDPDARLCNLLLTVIRRMGVEADAFGDSVEPLSEVLA